MRNLANEVLKYYFDLYRKPDSTFTDEIYVVEELERLSLELKNDYSSEEQAEISAAAKEWLSYFTNNTDQHKYTRKTSWDMWDIEFLEFMASGDFSETEIYRALDGVND